MEVQTKTQQFTQFYHKVFKHIKDYVLPLYGDFPDPHVHGMTEEQIKAKLLHRVGRIGSIENVRGKEEAIRDTLKIAHEACYLYALLTTGSADGEII